MVWIAIGSIAISLVIQIAIFAFFLGGLTQIVKGLKETVDRLEKAISSISDEIRGYTILFATKEDLAKDYAIAEKERKAIWAKLDSIYKKIP